jgi:hypothetical protein
MGYISTMNCGLSPQFVLLHFSRQTSTSTDHSCLSSHPPLLPPLHWDVIAGYLPLLVSMSLPCSWEPQVLVTNGPALVWELWTRSPASSSWMPTLTMAATSSTPPTTSTSLERVELWSPWTLMGINSQDETSEMFIGEWAEQRGIRDQLFIATKVR